MAEHFSLRWNNFHRNMSSGFRTLLMEDSLVDVTLAADGRFVQAHRLVLSVCSPYFKNLFSTTPCSHPIVVMKDVHFKQLTDILNFMYQGEVNVHQEELADFLKTAELLQIRGLAEQNVEDINSTTVKQVLPQSACHEPSKVPCSDTSSLSQGVQPRVRVSRLSRAAFNQKIRSQEKSGANRVSGASAPSGVSAAATQSVLHQSDAASIETPQVSTKQGPSTSMFIGVQVKEELPDIPSEAEQDVDALEYLTGDKDVDETNVGGPEILRNEEAEHPHVTEKNLSTAPSAHDDARKSPARSLSKSVRETGSNVGELPKTRHRRQRTLALHKIRRFLVTPKRSRRIAFARKMKEKKQVLTKSGLASENVSDISKQLPTIRRNTMNTKTPALNPSMQDHIYAAPPSSCPGISEDEIKVAAAPATEEEEKKEDSKDDTKRQSKGQDTKKLVAFEDSDTKIDTVEKRKMKANKTGKAKKYRTMSNDDKKNENANNTKNKKMMPLKNTKDGSIINRGSSALRQSNVNKKKIIVVIAAKKTKSAVAIARKMQSPVRNRTAMTVRSGSMERSTSGATVHLRSSTPNSNSSRDSTGSVTSGQACRHLGCLGCRGGN